MLNTLNFEQLKIIADALQPAATDFKNNRLDWMRWDEYSQQNEIRKDIVLRVKTKLGFSIFVVFGGNRSGKTELGAGVVAEIFGTMWQKRIWCATLSDISIKVQQRKLNSLIRKKDIRYGDFNDVRGWKNNIITSRTNSYINFKTYEQGRVSFQGDDLDVIWLDEECPWDIFQECIARITDRNGILLLTFTALMGFTRLVNFLWGTDNPDVKTTILTIQMNPFIGKAEKERFMRLVDPDEYESRIEGKPHLKQGLIYKEFSQLHQIDDFDALNQAILNPDEWKISEGIDPHERTPHHWIRFAYHIPKDRLYVIDCLKAPQESMLIKDFSRMLNAKRVFSPRKKFEIEYCQIDTSSMKPDVIVKQNENDEQENVCTIRTEFFKHGINTVLVQKDNALGINLVKGRLKFDKNIEGKIIRAPKLFVFKSCVGVIAEFMRYSWDSYVSASRSERKEQLNSPLKKDDHYMDIIKYECIKRNTGRVETIDTVYEEIYEGTGY